jgi:hypothetical protein
MFLNRNKVAAAFCLSSLCRARPPSAFTPGTWVTDIVHYCFENRGGTRPISPRLGRDGYRDTRRGGGELVDRGVCPERRLQGKQYGRPEVVGFIPSCLSAPELDLLLVACRLMLDARANVAY